MVLRARLSSLLLGCALLSACGAEAPPSGAVLAETHAPAATAPPTGPSRPTADPCSVAVTQLGAFTKSMAEDLVAIRSLVRAKRFDVAQTVAASRQVATVLTTSVGLEDTLRGCQATAPFAPRVEALRASAETTLDKARSALITDARIQRAAGVSLVSLLREVRSLAKAAATVAADLRLTSEVGQTSDGADEPIGSLPPLPPPTLEPTPRPTPKPTPLPKAIAMKPSFFGSNVKISTYKVRGGTSGAISSSMLSKGPYSTWLHGRAAGLTRTHPAYRFHFSSDGFGSCRIVVEAKPAIKLTYTIVLPRWTPPAGISAATILWWNGDLRDIATHERVHVRIYRSAAKRLNAVLASSTCASAPRRLDAVWNDAQRQNCDFDMKEYGTSASLSLKKCLAQ